MNRVDLFTDNFKFDAVREEIDEDGIWNPIIGDDKFKGGLQVNVYGDREVFLKLSKYFKLLSDQFDNHDHCEVVSKDGQSRLHFIFRAYPDGQ